MSLRKRIFIIISVLVGFVAVFAMIFLLFNRNKEPEAIDVSNDETVDETGQQGEVTNTGTPAQPESFPNNSAEVYAKQVTRIFVERFNSYSNQNDNQHIDDVLSMTTPVMASWLETQRLDESRDYRGVTTMVVASRVLSLSDSNAMVEVDTQQIVEENGGAETIQKSGRVELVKSGEDWKVDGFYWD